MGMIIRLVILVVVIYFIYSVYRKVVKPIKQAMSGGGIASMSALEVCPSCGERIRVPKTPVACPKCGTSLGRSPDGKLLIKIN